VEGGHGRKPVHTDTGSPRECTEEELSRKPDCGWHPAPLTKGTSQAGASCALSIPVLCSQKPRADDAFLKFSFFFLKIDLVKSC